MSFNFNEIYNRDSLLEYLKNNFLPEDFQEEITPLEYEPTKNSYFIASGVYQLGYSSKLNLPVFEIQHTSENDPRVSLTKETIRLLKYNFWNQAIILFTCPKSPNYRISLITLDWIDQKASNPKRYSFFVGKDAKIHTVSKMLKGQIRDNNDLIERFSIEVLSKEFYEELQNWFFLAIRNVKFPNDIEDDSDNEKYNMENLIRLITRLIFVWFLKQKKLINDDIFDYIKLSKILKIFDKNSKTQTNYYRAILQNLFFGTLNQNINKRSFALLDEEFLKKRKTYDIKTLYRYENEFQITQDEIIQLFQKTPFLNGGLFECLDNKIKDGKKYFWDGFSRDKKKQACIPNYLFFTEREQVDLSKEYNDKRKSSVYVSGILNILNKYNFTVEENTPLDIDVALDPELLGKVFENLLGAYNPETKESARKQTGSFYTPREIVSYMVDQSLSSYLQNEVPLLNERDIKSLIDYNENELPEMISKDDNIKKQIVFSLFKCKILDPACGSGAFPVGILQKMVHILRKLDEKNKYWREVVLDSLIQEARESQQGEKEQESLKENIQRTFDIAINSPDYARKLYLIENCIYGVDIQSIAVQISRLRFFISLICEQIPTKSKEDNYGIMPLPNLESNFVSANALISLEQYKDNKDLFKDEEILELIERLRMIRHRQFSAITYEQKKNLREKDEEIRKKILKEFKKIYTKNRNEKLESKKICLQKLKIELKKIEKKPENIEIIHEENLFGEKEIRKINQIGTQKQEVKSRIKLLESEIGKFNDQKQLNDVLKFAKKLTDWNPYDQNLSSEFFDPFWMFGFDENKGAFNIVIANPPYIDSERMINSGMTQLREYISNHYTFTKGNWDIYIAFFDKGLSLLKEKGFLSFITPDKWLVKPFGVSLRENILPNIKSILKTGTGIFESVFVDSIVTSIKKSYIKDIAIYELINNKIVLLHSIPKHTIKNTCTLDFLFSKNINLLIKIDSLNYTISDISKCYGACATGDAYKLKPLLSNLKNPTNEYLYVINTGTIDKYTNKWGKKEMTYLGKQYLYPVVNINEFKNDFSNSYFVKATSKKIIIKGMTLLDACIDTKGNILPGKSTLIIINNDIKLLKFILGIINSKLCSFYLKEKYPAASYCGGISFTPDMIGNIPIPKCNENLISNIATIVDSILISKKHDNKTEVLELYKQLNSIVYDLYNLTNEEVLLINQ